MKIKIKQFDVNMDVKANGIEFEVRQPNDSVQLGDCYLTMSGLTWCEGKKTKQNGIKISWADFMQIMKSEESKKAALKATKNS